MTDLNRREFVQTGAAVGLAAVAHATAGANSDAKTLGLALIGCGGQGTNLLRSFSRQANTRIVAVCDPDTARARQAEEVATAAGHKPNVFSDLRQALENDAVNAVIVATPDHWHGPATLLALAAGKHVYVEKPCAHNVREGRMMTDTARLQKRVVQVGTQSRSMSHVRQAMQRLRDGAIGDVLVAKAWNSQQRADIGRAQPSNPPPQFDYDTWVGPAPFVPFQANRHHYTWHWWYDFGTGDMGNDGVHELDIARWGLGVNQLPHTVSALGGKLFFQDDQQFPDTQYVAFEFQKSGQGERARQLIYEQRIWSPYKQEGFENGNAFYGTKGMLLLGKNDGWQLFGTNNQLREKMGLSKDNAEHHRDFLDAIRNQTTPHADIREGHLSAALCHLGNIATRLGRTLRLDPAQEKILDDPLAQAWMGRTYRAGHWATPNIS